MIVIVIMLNLFARYVARFLVLMNTVDTNVQSKEVGYPDVYKNCLEKKVMWE